MSPVLVVAVLVASGMRLVPEARLEGSLGHGTVDHFVSHSGGTHLALPLVVATMGDVFIYMSVKILPSPIGGS